MSKSMDIFQVLNLPVGTELKCITNGGNYKVERNECGDIVIETELKGNYLIINTRTVNFLFVKKQQSVSTSEAFKALDEEKIITSLITGNSYLKNDLKQIRNVKISEIRQTEMFFEELEGEWYIEEDE